MSTREEAEAAIHLWRHIGLAQKLLAFRADVSDTAISKIVNGHPEYSLSDDAYRRISEEVEKEFATRIDSLPLTVLALCEDRPRLFDEETTAAVVTNVRDKLRHLAAPGAVTMPQGIGGAIMRIGPEETKSGLYVIAVPEGSDNQQVMALIHELDHLKAYLARGLRPDFKPPRSEF